MKMRNSVQYLTRRHIVSKDDIYEFFYGLINDFGINFSPDEDFCGYINYTTGKPSFNEVECKALDELLNECWEVCEQQGLNIYEIAMPILISYSSKS